MATEPTIKFKEKLFKKNKTKQIIIRKKTNIFYNKILSFLILLISIFMMT